MIKRSNVFEITAPRSLSSALTGHACGREALGTFSLLSEHSVNEIYCFIDIFTFVGSKVTSAKRSRITQRFS